MNTSHTWILLRGLIRGCFHWHEFPSKLAAARPQDQVICIDLPGNGARFNERTPWSIEAMADDLWLKIQVEHQRIQQAQPDRQHQVHLLSISMGAMIAAELAKRRPNDFASLHMINTSFANFNPPWQRMRLNAMGSLLVNLMGTRRRERAILNWTSNQTSIQSYIEPWVAEAQRHPLTFRNALAQLLAAARYQAPKTAPCAQTRIYYSENDRLVSAECSRSIAKGWEVISHCHPSAGHDLPLDEPDWLIEQILSGVTLSSEDIDVKEG